MTAQKWAFFIAAFLMAPCLGLALEVCESPVATTEGPVVGLSDPDFDSCAWKGIPYAAPPVGDLRFRAPRPPAAHGGTFEAFEFSPACMQKESFTSGGSSVAGVAEDCLTLNIWSPQKAGIFPVMYWIHGGGLTVGASNYEMYDGARLAAEREVVVVSVNYRLNVFGFFASPEAAGEDEHGSTGNYGIQDQIRGLEWVRDNISEFSGDPGNVTIFGESAGGLSVCDLLASPPAVGLFHRAIIQSGGCDLTQDLADTFEQARALAEQAGCAGSDPLGCLRRLPADELLERGAGFGKSHVDGYVIPETPIKAIREKRHNHVPVMVGNTRDETNLFLVPMGVLTMPGFMIKAAMKRVLGDERYDEIERMYPREEFGRPAKRLLALASEAFCSRGFSAAEEISAAGPVYYYSFDWDDYSGGGVLGAFHGLEIPFVFGNVRLERDSLKLVFRNDKTEQKARPLAESMMSYWTNFARTGDPNGAGLPVWPAYKVDNKRRIHLDEEITVAPVAGAQLERYEYWADQKISTGELRKLGDSGQ